jgi:hypothetical protein
MRNDEALELECMGGPCDGEPHASVLPGGFAVWGPPRVLARRRLPSNQVAARGDLLGVYRRGYDRHGRDCWVWEPAV